MLVKEKGIKMSEVNKFLGMAHIAEEEDDPRVLVSGLDKPDVVERPFSFNDELVSFSVHRGMCKPVANLIIAQEGLREKDQKPNHALEALAYALLDYYRDSEDVGNRENKLYPKWYIVNVNNSSLTILLSIPLLSSFGNAMKQSKNRAIYALGIGCLQALDDDESFNR
jgi:hypothetical protein